ncbi:hypothetical protein A0H81_05253 [Grifola frondosa]|uniref:Uncharacterized protein n=1 Tax=Grifola frondosa TaxID=5627 RepID=A0A1C7MDI5_GRIFR|nr:hypothetical protein A0H81_05253 [Grifola frondosa]
MRPFEASSSPILSLHILYEHSPSLWCRTRTDLNMPTPSIRPLQLVTFWTGNSTCIYHAIAIYDEVNSIVMPYTMGLVLRRTFVHNTRKRLYVGIVTDSISNPEFASESDEFQWKIHGTAATVLVASADINAFATSVVRPMESLAPSEDQTA